MASARMSDDAHQRFDYDRMNRLKNIQWVYYWDTISKSIGSLAEKHVGYDRKLSTVQANQDVAMEQLTSHNADLQVKLQRAKERVNELKDEVKNLRISLDKVKSEQFE